MGATTELSRADVDRRLLAIGRDEIELERLLAALNAEVDDARARHAPEIERRTARRQERLDALENAVKAARGSLFDGRSKSLQTTLGVVGFRLGNASVSLRRGYTLPEAIAAVRAAGRDGWVRVREDLAKDRVGASVAAGEISPDDLRDLGVAYRAGRERFYAEVDHAQVLEAK